METVLRAEFGDQPSPIVAGSKRVAVGTESGGIKDPDGIRWDWYNEIVKKLHFIILEIPCIPRDPPKKYCVHVFVKRKILPIQPGCHLDLLLERGVIPGAVGTGECLMHMSIDIGMPVGVISAYTVFEYQMHVHWLQFGQGINSGQLYQPGMCDTEAGIFCVDVLQIKRAGYLAYESERIARDLVCIVRHSLNLD